MSEKKNREEEISEQQEAAQPAECAEQTPAEEAESAAPQPDPELEKAKKEAAEYKDKWIRSVAEFENFRKRNAETRHTSYMEGRADVLLKVFPVGDNLERALLTCDENTKKGIEMVLRSFKALLEGEGIEEINPVGEEFDPQLCEAIMSEPAAEGVEPGYVKEVFLKGYKRGDKVLRFAQVKVTT
ncbi:MAG TPA: nucleotide exchange factor GrpE [Candidatus Borkfalkia avistercoris]|uniref:Protein GrpE n=1 Tax=Candidatus Borkfalkia avistercoris TaxID=2838504 RepID=A0A9D2A7K6_9FIRM|nr:nucleotide exchange factor GrpE [Candidatus Borkfalkia avistercoris]